MASSGYAADESLKITSRFAAVSWFVLLASCLFWIISCSGDRELPSDREMIDHFQLHRARFETLASELRAETGLRRIGRDFVKPEGSLEEQEHARYLEAFRELGLKEGAEIIRQKGDVWLYHETRGISISGVSKGYLRATRPLKSREAELRVDEVEPGVYFRHIEGDWYLFLMSD